MSNLGTATVAIGVFDGVHVGHQALLRDAVASARARGIQAVAVTFDRDPDQVVSPQTAAPQLLTLADKLACIAESGVDIILVVPFTPVLAEMAPESFVDSILLGAMRPLAVHVGKDFRFGARATGDVATLQRLGLGHGFEVSPHDLVLSAGAPVSSTRIRSLIAAGDVVAAAALLCRKPRVAGIVHRGRGEGAGIGFPTANIVPVPYAALPANGVYAGRAILEDGIEWAAAISVGTPPTFPEARDYLEAHLVGFEGDLYDQAITLEFFEKLRDQHAYGSLDELTQAISADVEMALEIAGFENAAEDQSPDEDVDYTDEDLVEDPAALAAAEALVAEYDPNDVFDSVDGEWVEALDPVVVSSIFDVPGWTAFMITSPLDAAGIPYAWDPYEPGSIAQHGPVPIQIIQPFRLLVPETNLAEAQRILSDAGGAIGEQSVEPVVDGIEDDPVTNPVSDPAALAAAEAVVQQLTEESTPDSDDELVTLVDDLPLDTLRLQAIDARLSAAGVSAVWDPYPPQEAPLLRVGLFGENRFRIRVWNSQLAIAREAFQDFESVE
jgi:riboflavin kinase / FMN adenylyltransferase